MGFGNRPVEPDEHEKPDQVEPESDPVPTWPPRIVYTPGGVVAVWALTHNLPVTREMIEGLLACFSLTYDGKPTDDRPQAR